MTKLISFIVPTRNLEHLSAQFDEFEKSTADLSSIEFLVKIDTDHAGADAFMQEQVKRRAFSIKYINTPRMEGTFSLWIAIEQLFDLVDKDSYFVQILSDEPYFVTPAWDNVLRQYIGYYPDHVFRMRLSAVKFNNYATHYECAFRCDSFPIYTKRWLELTEGTGDCWGSDAYHQCVAYHLGLGPGGYFNFYRENSLCRDIVVTDMVMGGLEFGVGVSEAMQRERHIRNLREWRRLSSYKMQERFSYLARRMYCYIWAVNHGIDAFQLVTDPAKKLVQVVDGQGMIVFSVSYHVQRPLIFMQNLVRDIKTNYWLNASFKLQPYRPKLKAINHRARHTIGYCKQYCRSILQYPIRLPHVNVDGVKVTGLFHAISQTISHAILAFFSLLVNALYHLAALLYSPVRMVISIIFWFLGMVFSKVFAFVRVVNRKIFPYHARVVGGKIVRRYHANSLEALTAAKSHIRVKYAVISAAITARIHHIQAKCVAIVNRIAANINRTAGAKGWLNNKWQERQQHASRSSQQPVFENEYLALGSPGINVIFMSKYRLPPGIHAPSPTEKKVSLAIIHDISSQRRKFRQKIFKKMENKYD